MKWQTRLLLIGICLWSMPAHAQGEASATIVSPVVSGTPPVVQPMMPPMVELPPPPGYPASCGSPCCNACDSCGTLRTYSALRPLLPLRGPPCNVQIGRGILGQPKAYIPGQPIRNFVRYLTP